MGPHILRNTRVELREDRRGLTQSRTLTTFDVVANGELLSEHRTLTEAKTALAQLQEAARHHRDR